MFSSFFFNLLVAVLDKNINNSNGNSIRQIFVVFNECNRLQIDISSNITSNQLKGGTITRKESTRNQIHLIEVKTQKAI